MFSENSKHVPGGLPSLTNKWRKIMLKQQFIKYKKFIKMEDKASVMYSSPVIFLYKCTD